MYMYVYILVYIIVLAASIPHIIAIKKVTIKVRWTKYSIETKTMLMLSFIMLREGHWKCDFTAQ